MSNPRPLDNIIIHCSDSVWGDREAINQWHLEKGWKGVGYSGVILNGRRKSDLQIDPSIVGLFEQGREADLDAFIEADEVGAHALGYNNTSLGFCLIGKDSFELEQFQTLAFVCATYQAVNPSIKILGHCETGSPKTCPNFDMFAFRSLLASRDFTASNVLLFMQDWID